MFVLLSSGPLQPTKFLSSPIPFRTFSVPSCPVSPASSQSTLPGTHMHLLPHNSTFYPSSPSSRSPLHPSPLPYLWSTSRSSRPTSRTSPPPTLSHSKSFKPFFLSFARLLQGPETLYSTGPVNNRSLFVFLLQTLESGCPSQVRKL